MALILEELKVGEFEQFTTVTEYLCSIPCLLPVQNPSTKGCVLKGSYKHLDILSLPLCPQHPLGNKSTLVQNPKIPQNPQNVTGRKEESTNTQQQPGCSWWEHHGAPACPPLAGWGSSAGDCQHACWGSPPVSNRGSTWVAGLTLTLDMCWGCGTPQMVQDWHNQLLCCVSDRNIWIFLCWKNVGNSKFRVSAGTQWKFPLCV